MAERPLSTDRIVAAYAVLSGVALAFPHRPDAWPLLAAGHLALLAVALGAGAGRWQRGAGRWSLTGPERGGPSGRPYRGPVVGATGGGTRPALLRVLADWYPLVVIPLLYSELDTLNGAVWGGRYFDGVVLGWEQALFGTQPSVTLAAAAPWPALSETLHAAYLSYYPIIYLPPLVLYLRGRRDAFAMLMRPLVAAFVLHYLVFVYFPVQGPRYLFPAPGGAIADGAVYGLTHRILEAGSSRGSAFPSSHIAIAMVQAVAAFRFLPRAAPLVLLATLGLGVGAVYGGFHYAIDMIVGAAAGLAIGLAFLAVDRRAAAA